MIDRCQAAILVALAVIVSSAAPMQRREGAALAQQVPMILWAYVVDFDSQGRLIPARDREARRVGRSLAPPQRDVALRRELQALGAHSVD
jgi:hypothetical protein